MEGTDQLLKTILNSTSEGIYGLDLEAKCTFINPAALDFFGLTSEECLGKDIHLLTHYNYPDGSPYPVHQCPIFKAIKAGKPQRLIEEVFWHKNGAPLPGLFSCSPILEDGKITGGVVSILDLRERKRDQAEIKAGQDRTNAIWASITDAVAVSDPNGIVVAANPAYFRLYGFAEKEVIGRDFSIIFPAEQRAQAQRNYLDFFQTPKINSTVERTVRTVRGEEILVEVNYDFIEEDGKRTGMISVVRDITERRQVEKQIKEGEERFRQLAETVQEVFWLYDLDLNKFIYVSPAFEQIWGYSTAELYLDSNAPLKYVVPEDAHLWRAGFEGTPEGINTSQEYRIIRPDGSIRWLWERGFPVRNSEGKIFRVAGNSLDITHRKEIEAKLSLQTETLSTINQIGRVVSGELDLQKLVQAVTDAATELTGASLGAFFYRQVDENGENYTLYSISGVPREFFDKFPMPRNTPIFAVTFGGEGIICSDDITADPRYGHNSPFRGMPEGHPKVRSYLAIPVSSRVGEVLGGLLFGHPEVGVFGEREVSILEGLVAQVSVAMDNARLYAEAKRAIEARDEFLSVAAHELKTPITGLRGYAQLAIREFRNENTPNTARLKRSLEVIETQTAKMARLVTELLDVSRLSTGRLDLELQLTDLSALARQIIVSTQNTSPRHRLELATPGEVKVMADPMRLEQVIGNLIDNAVKYSPAGGLVWVEIIPLEKISDQTSGGWIKLAVQDQGMGIPEEHREGIFNRFYQAHRQNHASGMGLGLYISRQIIERHGGHIEAHFPPEGGARFVIFLPA